MRKMWRSRWTTTTHIIQQKQKVAVVSCAWRVETCLLLQYMRYSWGRELTFLPSSQTGAVPATCSQVPVPALQTNSPRQGFDWSQCSSRVHPTFFWNFPPRAKSWSSLPSGGSAKPPATSHPFERSSYALPAFTRPLRDKWLVKNKNVRDMVTTL